MSLPVQRSLACLHGCQHKGIACSDGEACRKLAGETMPGMTEKQAAPEPTPLDLAAILRIASIEDRYRPLVDLARAQSEEMARLTKDKVRRSRLPVKQAAQVLHPVAIDETHRAVIVKETRCEHTHG